MSTKPAQWRRRRRKDIFNFTRPGPSLAPGRLGSANRTPRVLLPTTRLPAGAIYATGAIRHRLSLFGFCSELLGEGLARANRAASETERSREGEAKFPSSEWRTGCPKRTSGEMAWAKPRWLVKTNRQSRFIHKPPPTQPHHVPSVQPDRHRHRRIPQPA